MPSQKNPLNSPNSDSGSELHPSPAEGNPSDSNTVSVRKNAELRTKPNRHYPFLARHPWVHAGTLGHSDGERRSEKQSKTAVELGSDELGATELACGDTVDLLDHDGNWVARGLINPASRLRLRLYSFAQEAVISDDFFANRIDEAIARRRLHGPVDPRAGERLLFSESDRISGLIVDRYANCLSVQFAAAALLSRGKFLIDHLVNSLQQSGTPCDRVIVRMDATTAKHEGVSEETLAEIASWQRGIDQAESSVVWYQHNDLEMAIDLQDGQKTGGYLDQKLNHLAAARYLAGRRVLDICTYTGGFALAAAKAGASEVIGVDSSDRALQTAGLNAERNGLSRVQFEKADCFDDMKARKERGEHFDAVILDPPRFAASRRQTDAALRAYGRLNRSALDLIPSGGILVTCSCSGRVSRSDFLNMLVDSGKKRGRDLVVLESLGPAPDHPFAVSCPESDYLKCVIAQVV